jgi:hypothetical protein
MSEAARRLLQEVLNLPKDERLATSGEVFGRHVR